MSKHLRQAEGLQHRTKLQAASRTAHHASLYLVPRTLGRRRCAKFWQTTPYEQVRNGRRCTLTWTPRKAVGLSRGPSQLALSRRPYPRRRPPTRSVLRLLQRRQHPPPPRYYLWCTGMVTLKSDKIRDSWTVLYATLGRTLLPATRRICLVRGFRNLHLSDLIDELSTQETARGSSSTLRPSSLRVWQMCLQTKSMRS